MRRKPKKSLPCPNPFFERILQEWRDEARQKGSKLQHAYAKALSSVQKYPLPLQSGQEATILEGIGESIAKKLDEALSSRNDVSVQVQGDCVQSYQSTSSCNASSAGSKNAKQDNHGKAKGSKEYIPGYRTGAYALLLTLYRDSQRPNNRGFMNKEDLQREAQTLSDKSFTLPDPGSRYTAWSSMSTLTKKGFVFKCSNPAKYSITPEGCALAEKLQNVVATDSQGTTSSAVGFRLGNSSISGNGTTGSNDAVPTYPRMLHKEQSIASIEATSQLVKSNQFGIQVDETDSQSDNQSTSDQDVESEFVLKPGTFDIVLCVDFIETTGGVHTARKEVFAKELTNNGVEYDVRKLQVGDFAWVARERTRPVPGQLCLPEGKELILDYIVERKRMDDLNSSIIDGRFREQKFRLKNCGLKHPIYLIEDFGSAQHLSLPESTLQQAIINTQVVDDFFIKRTRNTKESVGYLTLMTRFLQNLYMSKTLIACSQDKLEQFNLGKSSCDVSASETVRLMTFEEFSKETVKNKVVTVREMFGKQLMQISGMSADKAVVILDSYPTPKRLLQAYEEETTVERKEKMLSSLKYGKTQRSFGPAFSKLVYQVYCTKDWPS